MIVTSDARVRARMVTISSEVAGRIVALPVAAGDAVQAGELVVQLDDREASIALAVASLEVRALFVRQKKVSAYFLSRRWLKMVAKWGMFLSLRCRRASWAW